MPPAMNDDGVHPRTFDDLSTSELRRRLLQRECDPSLAEHLLAGRDHDDRRRGIIERWLA